MLKLNLLIVDPQIFDPIWSLCRDIESSVTTKSLVFVVGFYRSMQFSVMIGFLSFVLDYVATDFDNVATEF